MITLHHGDCLEVMKSIPDKSIDLVLTSPPYGEIKNYNGSLVWNFDIFKAIANELFVKLSKGACIIWVVADQTKKGTESGDSFKQVLYFKEIGLNIHDTMIFRKLNYQPLTHNRYEQEFEYIFCLSNGKPKTFNPIKVPCRYAGKKTFSSPNFYKSNNDSLESVGGYTIKDTKIKGNIFEYRVGSLTETSNFKHPAMFPISLVTDQLQSWSNEGDIIMDPFMGSGSTGVACKNLNRSFIGIEKNDKYFNIAKERIENHVPSLLF